ncbi:hypothetical protein H4R18_004882 [Coemansia javaensis]|uniref:SAP domain-containing protein n=1 Tax=Coemansia javaensis TaxID=2761396 RepID=A0A9W8LGF0_9FUNG|nr:hypothetical protein H4R18_004882 [Coemansia javaensis]
MAALVPSELKVAELRKELSARGLATNGLKKDLVARLEAALSGSGNDTAATADADYDEDGIDLLPEDEQAEADAEPHDDNSDDEPAGGPDADAGSKGAAGSMDVDEGSDAGASDGQRKRRHSVDADATAAAAAAAEEAPAAEKAPEAAGEAAVPEAALAKMQVCEGESSSELPRSPTDAIYIKNLERPLTVYRMKELLGKYGTIGEVWLNSIKTRAYASFATDEEAAAAFAGINKTRFPPERGPVLECGFITRARMAQLIEAEESSVEEVHNMDLIEAAATEGNCGVELVNTKGQQAVSKRQKTERPARASVDGKAASMVMAAARAAASESQDAKRPEPTAPQEEPDSTPRIEDDAHTRRTKAQPEITYRPLTDDEVAAKKAAAC